MRVFLDECVDWRLSRDIVGHDVKTARQMEWTALRNGELLQLASKSFDVFVTVDQNLSFQQNLSLFDIAVVVLRAPSNRLRDLRPLVLNSLLLSRPAVRESHNLSAAIETGSIAD